MFCQTKALVTDLTQYLLDRKYRVDCLHGDMDQNARERTMKSFRDRKVSMLICTDVASRGLDVKDVTHVVNYSIPRELDSYVHRIGRTARSGKAGLAMSLVTPSHRVLIGRIERMTQSKMREGKIPTRKEVGMKKVGAALKQFQDVANHERAIELMGAEWKTAIAAMTPEELAGRFLTLTFPEVFSAREEREEPAYERPAPVYNPHKVQVYATGKKPAYSSGYSNDKPAYGAKSYGGGKSYGAPRAAYPKPIGSTPSVKPMMNSAPAPVAAKSAAPAMKPAAAHAPKAAKPAMHVAKPAAAQAAKPAAGSPTWKTKAKKKTGLGWDKPLTRT